LDKRKKQRRAVAREDQAVPRLAKDQGEEDREAAAEEIAVEGCSEETLRTIVTI
jgi:hypothetical protein